MTESDVDQVEEGRHVHEVHEDPFGGDVDEDVEPFATFTLREKIGFLFDGVPPSCERMAELASWVPASVWMTRFSTAVVMLSVVVFMMDTLPQMYMKSVVWLFVIETGCVIWFLFELIIRLMASHDRLRFMLVPLNIIDVLAILPYFVDLVLSRAGLVKMEGLRRLLVLRVLRLTRVVRVAKLSKRSIGVGSIFETVGRSKAALSLLVFLLFIVLLIGSAAIFYLEQTEMAFDSDRREWIRPDGTISPFQSVYHTVWFSVVTITTVGYGDHRISSWYARGADAAMMLIGVFVIAFPTVILGSNFHDVHHSRVAAREENRKIDTAAAALSVSSRSQLYGDNDAQKHDPALMRLIQFRSKAAPKNVNETVTVAEPSTALEVLEYRVLNEPARSIFLIGGSASYAPLLTFQRDATDANQTDPPLVCTVQQNYPVGVLVGLTLILHSTATQEAADAAVRFLLPMAGKHLTIEPRPVRELSVSFRSTHPMLRDAALVTRTFFQPRGQVPVVIHLSRFDALPVFLRYFSGSSFSFDVTYDDDRVVSIPSTTRHLSG